ALLDMEEGEIVKLRGPGGWFVVRDTTSPIIMLATGIGITPMRSMLYALKDDTARPIHLIHSSPDYYLFADEFKELQKENDQIKLTYVAHREEFKEAIKAANAQYGQSAYYYMAGSPAAVSATKALLKAQGIKRNRRIHESFQGYKQ
ncbi:MAG: FAD-dependent oxidoreductase, partial [Bacilli bacterium]